MEPNGEAPNFGPEGVAGALFPPPGVGIFEDTAVFGAEAWVFEAGETPSALTSPG